MDRPNALMDLLDYGYGPMTPNTRQGLPNAHLRQGRRPVLEELAANPDAARAMVTPIDRMAYAIATQPITAADAIKDAMIDPSIGSVTNAGVQTAATVARPLAALKMLGGGYGASLAKDSGIFDALVPPANAASKGRREQAKNAPDAPALPGLTDPEIAEYVAAKRAIERGDFSSGAQRRMYESTVSRLAEKSAALTAHSQRLRDEQAASEYDRAVRTAESARDKELGRVRRFSQTEFGRTYEKTGGAAAIAGAAGLGALSRAATGPGASAVGTALKSYILPAIEGTGAAFAANSIPTIYDAMLTDADNPEKAAYQAYARELPPSHPRKQEFADYASDLEPENPVRTAAKKEYYDNMLPRLFISALEGVPGGISGANVPALGGRAISAMRGAGSGRGPAPPVGGRSGGQPNPQQPQQPQSPAAYDPAVHGPISRQYVDELLTYRHPTREAIAGQADTIGAMQSDLERRFASSGAPQVDPALLRSRAQETQNQAQQIFDILQRTGSQATNPRLRQQILDMITGRPGMLAVPGAVLATDAIDDRTAEIMKKYGF